MARCSIPGPPSFIASDVLSKQSGRPIPALDAILATVRSGLALQDTFSILDAGLRGDRAALQEHVKIYRAIYLAEGTPLLKPFSGVEEVLRKFTPPA